MRRFTPKTIIYNSWITSLMHIYLSHAFNTIINIQASINHFRISETTTQTHCLAHLLAQAEGSRSGEPPSPRWGLKKGRRSSHGISLRRDPSRLGETFARSENWASRLGDLSRKKGLGESLSISPRRDWLTWARLSGLATVFLQQPPTPVQNNRFMRSQLT